MPELFESEFIQVPKYIYWALYKEIYSKCEAKLFVDVGAYDGITNSNTYRLIAAAGWSGICLEPNPNSFKKLRENYENFKGRYAIHRCAAGSINHTAKLFMDGDRSRICQFQEDNFETVEIRTLESVLHGVNKYNLLSLDVEGYEIEVLKSYDISLHNPEVCIVETHDKNPEYDKTISRYCDEYFSKFDYRKIFSNYINTVYIHKSCGDISI